jgi:hypothetical protein
MKRLPDESLPNLMKEKTAIQSGMEETREEQYPTKR